VVGELRAWVRDRRNLVVYGPTGSGKTTLLNALASELPPGERVVTIEDVAELRLPGDHVVRLEARPGSAEGTGRVDVRDLVRAALRLRPDRIVVGEVRGAEALDMLWALSTGHRGSMSTLHADGPADALRRLEALAMCGPEALPAEAVRAQVAAAVDGLVGVARGADGIRRVAAVHRLGADGRLHTVGGTGPCAA
jgi:pilus assembly protein CpaF